MAAQIAYVTRKEFLDIIKQLKKLIRESSNKNNSKTIVKKLIKRKPDKKSKD